MTVTQTSDLLSVAGRVRDYLHAHHPDMLPTFSKGHFFELSDEVLKAVKERCWDITNPENGPFYMPENSRLPARPTILWYKNLTNEFIVCHEPTSRVGSINVEVFWAHMPPLVFGQYAPGSAEVTINVSDRFQKEKINFDEHGRLTVVVFAAAALDMINEPRITKRVVAGTRQSRRAMQRRFGTGNEQWHRIEWDLTKPKVERGERLGKGWHMPLHYTRGHWRRSEEGRGKAVLLPGKGWHTWVDGFWSGHPAYGIKRAVYAPRIGARADGRDRRTEVEGCEAAQ